MNGAWQSHEAWGGRAEHPDLSQGTGVPLTHTLTHTQNCDLTVPLISNRHRLTEKD